MNQKDHANLVEWLISVKGSSIPGFSSEKIKTGVIDGLLGIRIVVSNNMTKDTVICFLPSESCTWKAFTGLTTAVIDDPGLGKTIRVWEEGEAVLTDPKSVHLILDTITG